MHPALPLPRRTSTSHLSGRWLLASVLGAFALWAAPTAHAAERELSGVRVQSAQALPGALLRLNGAGIRFRGPFKVYTAALYTEKAVAHPDEFHANNGAKRLVLTMLREVDSTEMGRMFVRGIEKNIHRAELGEVMLHLARMGEIFSANKRLQAGEQLVIDWVPASGMHISVRGKSQGEPFVSPAFYRALMNIWLGASPADAQLKDALLGQTPPALNDAR